MLKQVAGSATSATALLEAYQAGSAFFFSSPKRTLLAEGEWARLPEYEGPDALRSLPRRVAELLASAERSGHGTSVAVGAVPFDHTKPAQLVVPQTLQWAGPLEFTPDVLAEQNAASAFEIREIPAPAEYEEGVNRILARLQQGDIQKVVLARSLHLTSSDSVNIHQLLRNLARHNTRGYTFAANLTPKGVRSAAADSEGSRTLIGASPELLVAKTGPYIMANPLAGSAARSDDPREDERRAASLLASAKDRHEHAVVVEAVVEALRPYCKHLDVPREPSLVQTNTMWHLSTEINGELIDPSTSSLQLAAALHPTPAVCGTPVDQARAVIQELEPFDRGFFTGMVGWCDANGDGEWAVTIRCAEVEGRVIRLFAGAGIVLGSNPEAELLETSAKFRTMLLAMGLNQPVLAGRKEG
ncbi:isochorismate synthase DhbC [Brevibacillus sp. MCWH]|jgi:isochorismate synthase|uniref:isochorismate synthase DhbC n=1 Tax=Brevibacillus sp. MCWH TaxID=2508871 RepID=UPI0014913EC5|nr:isochorismate synthase DhbC [Brevibacillus sp. MCWH]NNV02340.1 isochorismate synthase DhbC [Brevibacillus sp. MCWH]